MDNDPNTPTEKMYFPPTYEEWETVSMDSLGWDTSHLQELEDALIDDGTRAFIILKAGQIAFEGYYNKTLLGFGDFEQDDDWYWASAGKILTSFLTCKAQSEGFLSFEQSSSDFLGEGWTSLTPEQEEKITIYHHLSMTTGLDDGVSNNNSFEAENLQYKAEPGSRWAYHNAPYTITQNIIENAVGIPFETYHDKNLNDKIGMDGEWNQVNDNHVYFSTGRSMARFGHLILNKGHWDGEQLLDSALVEQMISPSQSINESYGLLWWLNGKDSYMLPSVQLIFPGKLLTNAPDDLVAGFGKDGQVVSVIPSQDLVIIRMGTNANDLPVPTQAYNDTWAILQKIII